jgi:transketolase
MLASALDAADRAEREGIRVRVVNVHTIKPIDRAAVVDAARETGSVITVEEHSVIGGLGSAVAEVLAEEHPVSMRMIGVRDAFGESGSIDELYEKHGLTAENILQVIHDVMNAKLRQ